MGHTHVNLCYYHFWELKQVFSFSKDSHKRPKLLLRLFKNHGYYLILLTSNGQLYTTKQFDYMEFVHKFPPKSPQNFEINLRNLVEKNFRKFCQRIFISVTGLQVVVVFHQHKHYFWNFICKKLPANLVIFWWPSQTNQQQSESSGFQPIKSLLLSASWPANWRVIKGTWSNWLKTAKLDLELISLALKVNFKKSYT